MSQILRCCYTPAGQLVLMEIDRPSPPGRLSGQYLGPVFPEAPKFADPDEDLAKLGISIRSRWGKIPSSQYP